jgi:hypothetical protein
METAACPWCSAPLVEAAATRCHSCGASVAQRDSLGGMLIPGVTGVDPMLAKLADSSALETVVQLQVASGVPPESLDTGFLGTTAGHHSSPMAGIVAGIVDLPWEATPDAADAATIGEPSDTAREVAERLDGGERVTEPPAEKAWRDLPPASLEDQLAGTEFDPWSTQTQADEAAARPFDPWANQTTDPWSVDGGPWSDANPPQWTAENRPETTATSRPDERQAADSTEPEPPEK